MGGVGFQADSAGPTDDHRREPNMLDNAGISGGPLIGIKMGAVGRLTANGRSVRGSITVKADADIRSIREAIDAIIIPSNQVEMLNIINSA